MAKYKTKWQRMKQMIDVLNQTNVVGPKDFDAVSFNGAKTASKSPLQDYMDRRAQDKLEDDREPNKAQLAKARKQFNQYNTKINKLQKLGFVAKDFELLEPEAVAKLSPQDKRDYTNQLKIIDNLQRVQSYDKLKNKTLQLIWYINDNKLSHERIHYGNLQDFLFIDRAKGNKIIDDFNKQAGSNKLTINERKFLSDANKIKTENIMRTEKSATAELMQKWTARNKDKNLDADAKARNMFQSYESRLVRNQEYLVKAKLLILEVKKAGPDRIIKMYDKWVKNFDYYLGFAYDYDSYGVGESAGWTIAYERLRDLANEILGQETEKGLDTNYSDGILYR